MKKITLLLLLLFVFKTYSQTILNVGDIAILKIQADNPDDFTFITFVDIAAGTKIYFTDCGVVSSGNFGSNPAFFPNDATACGEGASLYTAPTGGLDAGDIITFSSDSNFTPYTDSGMQRAGGGVAISTAGDQILVFQDADGDGGTVAGRNPKFIFIAHNSSTVFTGDGSDGSTQSNLPTGLSDTTSPRSAVGLGKSSGDSDEWDNTVYNGSYDFSSAGNKAAALAAAKLAMTNPNNFTKTDNITTAPYPADVSKMPAKLTLTATSNWSLGDIAFTGIQLDSSGNPSGENDQFSFVLLRDVTSGEKISFTDRGWISGGDFRDTSETSITLEFNANYSYGTQISIDASLVAINAAGGSAGTVTGSALSLSTSGDQIFAYDTLNEPSSNANQTGFIAAIQMNGDWDASAISSTTSAKPSIFDTLANSSVAITPEVDNGIYNCSTNIGNATTLRAAIHNSNNWLKDNDTPFDQPANCVFSLVSSNQAPVATAFPTPTVLEDATNVALGNSVEITDADGDNQTVTITSTGGKVTVNGNTGNNVSVSGTLAAVNTALNGATFSPTPNLNGTNAGAITVASNDGTVDSNIATVTFNITTVNDEPSFTNGSNQTVNEDSGAKTVNNFATNIDDGDSEVTQTVAFTVTNNNNGLFSTQPSISTTGMLSYTPATNVSGTAIVSVTLADNGGTANGGDDTSATQTFTITVNSVNDEPSFTNGSNQTNAETNTNNLITVNSFATAISDGDGNTQTLTFNVTNNNNGLFSTQPQIDATGNLTYTILANQSGTATVSVTLMDNGGTANGGDDTSATETFTIQVIQIPTITSISDDTGASTTDYITSDNTPTVNGKATPNSTIFLIVNGNSSALAGLSATTDSNGDYTFPFPAAFGMLPDATANLSAVSSLNGASTTSAIQVVTVDTANPSFTSANTASFTEKMTGTVYSATSTDATATSYSISGGVDQADLSITSSGLVTFNAIPDFDNPADSNMDNDYIIEITATDVAGNTSIQTLTITVTTSKFTWTGNTDNDWNIANNWNPVAIPPVNAEVTIPSGLTNYPTITTAVTINSITINSGATLIANNTITGTVSYKRNLPTTNWYLLSSPVSSETFEDLLTNHTFASGTNGNLGLAEYDNNSANNWSYAKTGKSGVLSAGKGVSIKLDASGEVTFSGTANTTNINFDVQNGADDNFNLLGNPFTSFIISSTFATANTGLLSEETVWLWDGSQYITYNAVSPIEIAPAQGFFVESNTATAQSAIFATANQSHQSSDTFMRNTTHPNIELYVESDKTKLTTKVFYVTGKTTGFDNGYDSKLFGGITSDFSAFTELLTDNIGKKLAIQTLPNEDFENMIIPVGLVAKAGKEITFSALATNLPNGISVILEDRTNGTFTDLSTNTFKTTIENNTKGIGQFYLHTSSRALSTATNLQDLANISLYKSEKQELTIANLTTDASLMLYSVLGKKVFTTSITTKDSSKVILPNLSAGIYVARLQTANGKISKKIILE